MLYRLQERFTAEAIVKTIVDQASVRADQISGGKQIMAWVSGRLDRNGYIHYPTPSLHHAFTALDTQGMRRSDLDILKHTIYPEAILNEFADMIGAIPTMLTLSPRHHMGLPFKISAGAKEKMREDMTDTLSDYMRLNPALFMREHRPNPYRRRHYGLTRP